MALLALATACSGEEAAPPPREVPVFPGATLREQESAFQQRLLALVLGPGRPVPPTRIYETPASFSSVAEFYERELRLDSLPAAPFGVSARMRELAAGVRAGSPQQLGVGRLLFGRGRAEGDSLPAAEVADSLEALAARLADVQGTIALARVALATSPPSEALVSIERPHLNSEALRVDSVTVITIAGGPPAPGEPSAPDAESPAGGDTAATAPEAGERGGTSAEPRGL